MSSVCTVLTTGHKVLCEGTCGSQARPMHLREVVSWGWRRSVSVGPLLRLHMTSVLSAEVRLMPGPAR